MISNLIYGFWALIFTTFFGHSADFAFDHLETEKVAPDCKRLLVLTHPSEIYDRFGATELAVRELVQWVRAEQPHLQRLLLAGATDKKYDHDQKNYFVSKEDVNEVICSQGGNHSLQVTNNTTVLLAGGYWGECQLRTVRDLIQKSNLEAGETLKLVYITDAIFLSFYRNDPPMDFAHYLYTGAQSLTKKQEPIVRYLNLIFDPITYSRDSAKGLDDFNLSFYMTTEELSDEQTNGFIKGELSESKKILPQIEFYFLTLRQLKSNGLISL